MSWLTGSACRSVEGMHQQLLQFAAVSSVRNIRSLPVLGVAKNEPLPIADYPAASIPVE
jgi:hypothetical protein